MTNKQYTGIIKAVIEMISDGTPRKKIIKYLMKLIE